MCTKRVLFFFETYFSAESTYIKNVLHGVPYVNYILLTAFLHVLV